MNKSFKGLLLTLVFIISLTLFSGCGNKKNDDGNDPKDDYYLTCLETEDIILDLHKTHYVEYDTNIFDPITFTSSNEEIATVDEEGLITAISKGSATITLSYEELSCSCTVKVIGEEKQDHYLTVEGIDKIKLRSYKMTIAVYLKHLFGDKMHKDYQGKKFGGYYLDPLFTKPVDLQTMIDTDLTIYPKYMEDTQKSDMVINLHKVLIHDSKVEFNDRILAFSADFGDTIKYEDLTYEKAMILVVRYDFDKNAHFITSITKDGNKQDTKIPYDGFVVMIPQTNEIYNDVKDTLKVGDKIDLNDYSINRATTLYVNKEIVKYADKLKLNINCKYISVYDATNEVMIYEQNQFEKARPASTTKIITALAALQHTSLDTIVTIGDELDVMWEGSTPGTAKLEKGQRWTMRQLLYAMLLPSGNDAAYSVAAGTIRSMKEYQGLSVREQLKVFNGFMNDVAKQVGATRSHFMVPDGNSYYKTIINENGEAVDVWEERLTEHYVTSDDMLKFARLAFNYPGIALVTSTPRVSFKLMDNGGSYSWVNTNRLLRENDSNYYPYAVGMKTGTTTPAGECLIAGAYRDGRMIIVSLLNNEGNRFSNAKKVFETVLQ